MAIKNLKKAAERILKAIKQKENIILYGDADLDGTTSVIILKETVQNLNGKIIAVYFPDREIEGYGISEIGLNFLKTELPKEAKVKKKTKFSSSNEAPEEAKVKKKTKFSSPNEAPALLIVLDCGIGNFREVKLAKKLGFEVIIIDHHEILDKLPQAKIIVDPKQKGDKYPFKGLATVGIAFELSELLLRDKMTPALRKNFLELVALATLADMMPQESENKVFIEEGLQSLENSWRPGIKAFFETEFFDSLIGIRQKVGKMISILNVRDVKNQLPASFRLLNTPSLEEAKIFIEELLVKNKIRRAAIEKIIEEIEKRIAGKNEPIIFEGDVFFEMELMGAAASITCQQCQKPTFLYKKMKTESQGTVRILGDINSVTLMKKCSKYLLTYGGHPRASGFRIKNENLEKFKECLICHFKQEKK